MSVSSTRGTGNTTAQGQRGSGGGVRTAFAVVVLAAVAFLCGFGAISQSHRDPDVVMCSSQVMAPGDTCTTYSNSSPVRTADYEQERAEQVADIGRDKVLGPVLVVVGSLLVAGVVVSGLVAASRPRRP